MTPVGRNAPCPCGSGKRYKDCHGAIGTPAAPRTASAQGSATASWVPQALHEALQAQHSGRAVEAAQLYRRVLAADPSNFDAMHMLSLAEYEGGHYDEALALIKQAIQLRPELGIPRQNLRLLESLPMIEIELCREVLPRLTPRVDCAFDLARLTAAALVHVVIDALPDDEDGATLARVIAACGAAPVKIWHEAGALASTYATATLTTADHPRGGILVLFGTARSQAGWLHKAHPDGVLLIVTRDDPCTIIDRIDELAATVDPVPGLLCATHALAARLRLPLGATLTPGEIATRPQP
jgi:hypothetical protein